MRFYCYTLAAVAAAMTESQELEQELEQAQEFGRNLIKKATAYLGKEVRSYEVELGRPAMVADPVDSKLQLSWLTLLLFTECHGLHHLCSSNGEPVVMQAGHHARAKTNQPIFGVLTQPIPEEWRSVLDLDATSYFESSHAEFLQAAGARTVAIDYRLSTDAINEELANLNGVYIPGDAKINLEDPNFMHAVSSIIYWAGTHNDKPEEDKHFPVVGVSYGYLAMLQSQDLTDAHFTKLGDSHVRSSL